MNLRPPPQIGESTEKNIEEMFRWMNETYQHLKYPAFHLIRLIPRNEPTENEEGLVYYDKNDDKAKVYTTEYEDMN